MIDNGGDRAFVERRFVGDGPFPNRRLRRRVRVHVAAVAADEQRKLQQAPWPQIRLSRAFLAQCMAEGEGVAEVQPSYVVGDALAAVTWLQRESGHPLRVPIGVIGPREATDAQLAAALKVGELLGDCGLTVLCGGRQGVMQAVCEGVARVGGLSLGLLPESEPSHANPYVGVVIATGIGEARNALIARASFCMIAIGDSLGTLSEVALGRQFDKRVIGLEGAATVEGVQHVASVREAVVSVMEIVLAV